MGAPTAPGDRLDATLIGRTVWVPPLVGALLGAGALLLWRRKEACGEELDCLGDVIVTLGFVAFVVPLLATLALLVARVPKGWLVAASGVAAGWALGSAVWLFRASGASRTIEGGPAAGWAFLGVGAAGALIGVAIAGVGPWGRRMRTGAAVVLALVVAVLVYAADYRWAASDGDLASIEAAPVTLYAPNLGPSVGGGEVEALYEGGFRVRYDWTGAVDLVESDYPVLWLVPARPGDPCAGSRFAWFSGDARSSCVERDGKVRASNERFEAVGAVRGDTLLLLAWCPGTIDEDAVLEALLNAPQVTRAGFARALRPRSGTEPEIAIPGATPGSAGRADPLQCA